MSKKYQRRVSGMIRKYLVDLLGRKANDPRLQMVTITDVTITPDTRYADVHYSVIGGIEAQAETQAGLESATGWLRRELGQRLRLRHTPALAFHYDPSLERGEHISSILDELRLGEESEPDREEHDDASHEPEAS
jgi:ribosome-binding factor A